MPEDWPSGGRFSRVLTWLTTFEKRGDLEDGDLFLAQRLAGQFVLGRHVGGFNESALLRMGNRIALGGVEEELERLFSISLNLSRSRRWMEEKYRAAGFLPIVEVLSVLYSDKAIVKMIGFFRRAVVYFSVQTDPIREEMGVLSKKLEEEQVYAPKLKW